MKKKQLVLKLQVVGQLLYNNKMNKKNSKEGSILIESVVSVSLILIGLLGVFGLISKSIRDNKNVYLKTSATYLASEGIEVMKNIIDTDVVFDSVPWNETIGNAEYETFEVAYDFDKTTLVSLGTSSSTRKLVIDGDSGFFSYSALGEEIATPFTRTISVYTDGSGEPEEMKIVSVVEWNQDGVNKKVNLETIFTNWRND